MNVRLITMLSALIGFGAISSQASPITGFGSPTSAAALTGGSVETFDAAAAGVYSSFTTSNGVTISGNSTFTLGPDYIGQFNNTGVNSIFNGPYGSVQNSLSQWTFTFGGTVNAFGFNFGASDLDWTLAAYDSSNTLIESYVIPATHFSNLGEYFGFGDAGIASATLTAANNSGGDWVFIDNLTIPGGGGSTVPDGGSTLALLGGAMTALAFFSRRKRR